VTWSALWSSIYIFSLLSDFFFVLICLAIYVFLAQELAQSSSDKVAELKMLLETESNRRKASEEEMTRLKWQPEKYTQPEVSFF
jgi:Tfp pilus assembly protein PilN